MSSGTCTLSKTIKEKTVSSEAVFVVELAVNHRVDAEGGSCEEEGLCSVP